MNFASRFATLALIVSLIAPLGLRAQSVALQTTSPGTQETGNLNINGIGIFGTAVGIGTTNPGPAALFAYRFFSSASSVRAVYASSVNNLGGITYGVLGNASNTSSGTAFGGHFSTTTSGTGVHIGVQGTGNANSGNIAYGVYGLGDNMGAGRAYGGFFQTYSNGTGIHYGVLGLASGNSASASYGVYGQGDNSSTGTAYGGYFTNSTSGTGIHYGVIGSSSGSSTSATYGVYGTGTNTSSGTVYGGFFTNSSSGTGTHYGLYSQSFGGSSTSTTGAYGLASNTSTGVTYGGYFTTTTSGTGSHYGSYSRGNGNSSTGTYGISGYANNTSNGTAHGGYFSTSSSGTGQRYGVLAEGYGSAGGYTYGVYGRGTNTSSGDAYGGYFLAASNGTGVHYGVYAYEAIGGSGAAIYAAGDFFATGTKNALVKTSQGHQLLYAQESPEVWFEDFGSAQLVNGHAHIALDQLFLETVTVNSQHPLKVFVQLTSGMPVPVVVEKGATGFEVRAQDQLNATFDYRVVAKRKGYENERLRKTDAGYDDPNLYPHLRQEMERKWEEEKRGREAESERHEREQLLQQKDREQHEREQLLHQRGREQDQQEQLLLQEERERAPEAELHLQKAGAPSSFQQSNEPALPQANALIQNHPNPFNPSTSIPFEVKQAGRVTLKIYNNLGQEVANLVDKELPGGKHAASFDASDLPSGVYFYRLTMSGFTEVKKLTLMK